MSRDSATCRYYRKDRSATIPINQNHSNMVKFSRGDATMGVVISLIKEICSASHVLQHPEMNAGVSVGFDHSLPGGEATLETTSVDVDIGSEDLPCEEPLKALGKLLDDLDSMFKPLLPRLFPIACTCTYILLESIRSILPS